MGPLLSKQELGNEIQNRAKVGGSAGNVTDHRRKKDDANDVDDTRDRPNHNQLFDYKKQPSGDQQELYFNHIQALNNYTFSILNTTHISNILSYPLRSTTFTMSARFITLAKSRVATSAPSSVAIRSISSTARLQKGPVETAKDTLKKTDRMVSDAAVGGIDKGGM
jgi:hypothetical protein